MSQGHAKIEFEADLSPAFEQVGPKLEQILTRLETVASKVFAALETDAQNAATSASSALDKIDGSGLDNISKAAETAAAETTRAVDGSMGEVQRALGRVDASGLTNISNAADAAAEQTTSAISGSTAAVTSSISNIDASGFTNVSSAAGAAAEAVAGVATAADAASAQVASSTSSINDSLGGVDTQASKTRSGIDGLGGISAGALGKMGGYVAGAVGGWKLLTSAIDRAGDTAAVEASLTGLYGSAEAAADMMGRIADISSGSSISTEAYAGLAQGLGYLGVEGQQAEDIMHNLGKAIVGAGGDSSNLDSVVGALTRMQNEGKVTRDSLAQLSSAGVPILDSLANALGVEVNEVLEMATDGLLDVNQVMGVLEDGTGEWMERLIEAGDAVDDTFGARWERAKDQVMGAIGQAILPVMESLAPVISWVSDGIAVLFSAISGGEGRVSWLSGFMTAVRDGAQDLWAAARPAITQLRDFFTGALIPTLRAFWDDTLQPILSRMSDLFQRVFVDVVIPYLQTLWDVLTTQVMPTILDFYENVWLPAFTKIGDLVRTVWENFLAPVFEALVTILSDVVAPAVMFLWENVVGPAFQGIGAAVEVAWKLIEPIIDLLIAALDGGLGGAVSWLWDHITQVFGWIGDAFSGLGDFAGGAVDRVTEFFEGMIGFITDLPGRIAGIAVSMFTSPIEFASTAKDTISGYWDEVVGFVSGMPERIGRAASGMWDGVKDAFKSAINWIIRKWNALEFTVGGGSVLGMDIPEVTLGVPKIPEWADGGHVTGPGGPRDDLIPAMLSNGEYVINAASTARYLPILEMLNAQRFADGGLAGRRPTPAARGGDGASLDDPSGALLGVAGAAGLVQDAFDEAIRDGAEPAWQSLVDQLEHTSGDTVTPVLDGMRDRMRSLGAAFPATTDEVIRPALDHLRSSVDKTGAATADMVQTTAIPQWAALGQKVTDTGQSVLDPAMTGMQARIGELGQTTSSAVTDVMVPQWQHMGASVLDVKEGTVDPVFAGIQGGLETTAEAFGTGATAIATQWDRVREATASPVRFAITSVFNDGIVGMWNSVSDLLGTDRMAPYPLKFAVGGRVPGSGDNDSVPAMLMPDEFVMSRPMIRAIGAGNLDRGLSMLETVRRATGAASNLGAEGLFSAVAGRYSAGGVVKGTPAWESLKQAHSFAQKHSGKPYVWGGSLGPSGGTDCSGFMSSIADVILGGSGLQRKWATGGFPGGGTSQTSMANVGGQSWAQGLAAGFSIGVSNVHTAGTLGGVDGLPTVNVESGGSPSRVKYGAGAAGADHSQFPTRWHLPIGAGGFVSGGAYGGSAVSFEDIIGGITGPAKEQIASTVAGWPVNGLIDTMPGQLATTMTDAVDAKIDALVEELGTFEDPGGSGVERWRPLVQLLLERYGLGLEHTDRTLRRMNQESGGNPRAINLWDSNAQAGVPSKGLMQVIDPTFEAHRDPALSPDIWDPMANVGASMRYAMATYGSLPAAYDKAGGYHTGGLLPEGEGWWHKTAFGKERVLSPEQNQMFEEMVSGLTRGAGGVNIGGVTVGAEGDLDIDPRRVTRGGQHGGSTSSSSRTVLVTQNFHGPTDPERAGRAVNDRLLSLIN